MHKSEINKLHAQVKEKGFSLVPLNFHFSHGYVKVTVGPVSYTHLDVYKRQVLGFLYETRQDERLQHILGQAFSITLRGM